MTNIEKKQPLDKSAVLQRANVNAEAQTFGGAAKQYVRGYGWLKHIQDFLGKRTEAGEESPLAQSVPRLEILCFAQNDK